MKNLRPLAAILVAAALGVAAADHDLGPSDPRFGDRVWIPGGWTRVGSNEHYAEESPSRRVHVRGFWMDRHEVTNAQFAAFVEATGYVTTAERPGPDSSEPGSAVFGPDDDGNWSWRFVAGASWRRPTGPASDLIGLNDHPVVQVSYQDARAYAAWRGAKLPTELQFEHAARRDAKTPDEVRLVHRGTWLSNTWQGAFPQQNEALDGFASTAPVGSFPPGELGVHDLIGNVWELTRTAYFPRVDRDGQPDHGARSPGHDPRQPGVAVVVLKGGSYLCSPNACRRYRPSARQPQDVLWATNHIGFRTVYDSSREDMR